MIIPGIFGVGILLVLVWANGLKTVSVTHVVVSFLYCEWSWSLSLRKVFLFFPLFNMELWITHQHVFFNTPQNNLISIPYQFLLFNPKSKLFDTSLKPSILLHHIWPAIACVISQVSGVSMFQCNVGQLPQHSASTALAGTTAKVRIKTNPGYWILLDKLWG